MSSVEHATGEYLRSLPVGTVFSTHAARDAIENALWPEWRRMLALKRVRAALRHHGVEEIDRGKAWRRPREAAQRSHLVRPEHGMGSQERFSK